MDKIRLHIIIDEWVCKLELKNKNKVIIATNKDIEKLVNKIWKEN